MILSCDDHLDIHAVPPDLWTSRLPARWRDRGPRVEARDGQRVWVIIDTGSAVTVGNSALRTALAAQGFELLAIALAAARPHFLDAALAYVRFALEHPGHYRVMFDKSLLDPSNPELVAAESAAGAELSRGAASLSDRHAQADPRGAQLAAWSLVHGFSMLWLNDAVNPELRATDPMATVERIARMLFDG